MVLVGQVAPKLVAVVGSVGVEGGGGGGGGVGRGVGRGRSSRTAI